MSEKELISACKAGERRAFVDLYNTYGGALFGVCMRYARNREDAEDILQNGFTKVYENLNQYKFQGSFEGWMKRIMVNCALQHYRKKSDVMYVEQIQEETTSAITYENAVDALGHEELLNMIQKLPFGCRTVFNMYAIEGFSHKEIAAHLGVTVGTSKSQLSDGRRMLRNMINKEMFQPQNGTNG